MEQSPRLAVERVIEVFRRTNCDGLLLVYAGVPLFETCRKGGAVSKLTACG
jgi:hypothetical protein